jgi:DNA-binding XRE family transcriptional regulator
VTTTALVRGADRMLVSACLTEEGLHVRFADGGEGVIPVAELRLPGEPAHLTIPSPWAVEIHLNDSRVEEVPWDFARHFVDPGYRAGSEAAGARGRRIFGERLRALRSERGLTQEDLAERSGIHRVTIARLESGERLPRYPTIEALARGLGILVNRLIAG